MFVDLYVNHNVRIMIVLGGIRLTVNVFSLIRAKYHTLSSSQKTVADYVLNNSSEVMLNTLNEIANACGVSETTVLRFLHKIDFNSYQLFKISLTQELSKDTPAIVYEDISFNDTTEQIIGKVVSSTISSLNDSMEMIDPISVEKFIDKIISANKILIIGVGASGSLATDMFHKMMKLGLNVVYSNDPHLINILSMSLTPNDFLIAFSHSGESREILDGVAIAHEEKCKVGAITSYSKSTLSNKAEYVICSSSLETKFRSDAMTSRIIQMVIVDIIYVSIVTKLRDKVLPSIQKSSLVVAKNKT
ncbi:MAG: MurR/RpiR family transcriptional regulator [Anaerolineaceae bacterium]|nr:MAG: MurR/RpiR family transcriptional regulator [Anaerolineaceae bacterium]